MTQRNILLKHLTGEWIPVYKLRSVATPFGFLGNQADRRLRELYAEGKIERKIIGKYAHYRALVHEPVQTKIYGMA